MKSVLQNLLQLHIFKMLYNRYIAIIYYLYILSFSNQKKTVIFVLVYTSMNIQFVLII